MNLDCWEDGLIGSVLESPQARAVLNRLAVLGQTHNAEYATRVREREAQLGEKLYGPERARLGVRAPQAVSAAVGRVLYALVLARRPAVSIEFGGSFGVSTICLAAALTDLSSGRLVTTELIESKATALAENLNAAGVADRVEVLQGDARQTLGAVEEPVEMVFLDGSNDLYLEVLRMLEPQLSVGAVIAADLSAGDPHHERYRRYVSDPERGYIAVEIPIDAGLVVATRI